MINHIFSPQDQYSELKDLCHIQQKLLDLKEQEKQQQLKEIQVSILFPCK